MQPGINIVYGQGGLGRPLPGQDYISELVFYTDTLPSGFDTTNNKKQFLSLQDAVNAGIKNDFSDETQGKGTVQITNHGNNGDTIIVTFAMPNGQVIILGSYTKIAADSTIILVGVALRNAINALSSQTGFSATFDGTDTLTITFCKGLGIYPNSGSPLAAVVTGALAQTTVNSTVDGVASLLIQWWYHIKEYFRLQPQGNVFVGFYPLTANTFDFKEIKDLQNFAKGTVRQAGVYLGNTDRNSATLIQSAAQSIQTVANSLATIHAPLSVITAGEMSTITDLTTLHDLSLLSSNRVSISIGQDGAKGLGEYITSGWSIYKATGKSIGDVGTLLGCISLSAVNESQAWVQKFNLTDGQEFSVPAFANGHSIDLINDDNLMTLLDNYRYCFEKNYSGKAGTFLCNNPTAIAASSDYAYINDNRVIDKAARNLYVSFLPFLSGTITLNADGTIRDTDIAYLITLGNQALDPMITAGEISADGITIDPTQKILQTNNLVVAIKMVPDGVARFITINLGYAQSV